jgi:transposase
MTLLLPPGPQHEATVFEALMAQGAVKRPHGGRPKLRPRRLIGDKGDSSGNIRRYLRAHGIRITMPRRKTESRTGPFARARYRQRSWVERLIHRLKQHRRLATRYEKCAENYRALWLFAATLLWLDFANTA